MNKRLKTIGAVAAVALLLAGGAVAAVTATGSSTHHARAGLGAHGRAGGRDLRAASSYLGLTVPQLESDLRSGESLAQVAQATPGRSVGGLLDALVASKRARLAKALTKLPQRVQREIARMGGPGGAFTAKVRSAGRARKLFAAPARLGASAAAYIGISTQQLRSELESGKTLAQIARAHGGSEAGLISVLVKAKQSLLRSSLLAGVISRQDETALLGKLEERVRKLVNRSFAASKPS